MADHFLQLSSDKTEILISAPPSFVPTAMEGLGSLRSSGKSPIENRGVTVDQVLILDQHVKLLIHSCFLQLRNITEVRPIVYQTELEM